MAEELVRDFKGVWIPKEIWLDENLNKMQMLLYVEIDSLSSNTKGCFASNKHFANFLRITPSRASQLVSDLKTKGYIKIKLFYAPDNPKQVIKREIYPVNKLNGVVNKFTDPTKNINSPYLENCEESNTGSVIHISNTSTVGKPDNVPPYRQIIEYLNKKTDKKFKYSTSKTKKLIDQRWNEGFRLHDLEHVIDIQTNNWLGTDMDLYLRPETLFGSKFESYLNSNPSKSHPKGTKHKANTEKATDWKSPENQSRPLTDTDSSELAQRLRRIRNANQKGETDGRKNKKVK